MSDSEVHPSKIQAGIVGGAGYTGGEMLRILLNHPNVALTFVHSRSNSGEPVYKVHTDLLGDTELRFSNELQNVDVLFLCVGHGEAKTFLQSNSIKDTTSIIDLSQDFRLRPNALLGNREFIYGLPELNKDRIKTANNIANPGCFATAIQLGLLPLAKAGLLGEVHTSGVTGSTGAGQKMQASSHFSWRANNIQAYKSLSHQHIDEIMQSIGQLQPAYQPVNFIPMRGDFPRGIYVTSYTHCDMGLEAARQLYKEYYADAAFTHVSNEMIDMKQVVNTNKCILHLEKQGGQLIIHTAIDNLLKGASGQAVQNMNLMFGLPEQTGLHLKGTSF